MPCLRSFVAFALALLFACTPVEGKPPVKQITFKASDRIEKKRDIGLALVCFAAGAGLAYYSMEQFGLAKEAEDNQWDCVYDGGDAGSCERQYPSGDFYLKGVLGAVGSAVVVGVGLDAWRGKAERKTEKPLIIGVKPVRRGMVAAAQVRF